MTNPSNNLKALASEASLSKPPGALALWGGPLALTIVGATTALVVWFDGETFGLISPDVKFSVLLWIPLVVVLAILVYLVAILLGAGKAIARLFARETGETRAPSATKRKRDARLEDLCCELRRLLGWRWRYRMPWLLLCGDEAWINEVAPA